jgi:hypothetical protein
MHNLLPLMASRLEHHDAHTGIAENSKQPPGMLDDILVSTGALITLGKPQLMQSCLLIDTSHSQVPSTRRGSAVQGQSCGRWCLPLKVCTP